VGSGRPPRLDECTAIATIWTQSDVTIATPGRGFVEITPRLRELTHASGIETGVLHAFARHTSASLLITENADADVRRDLESWLARWVVDGDPDFVHRAEGADDMAAHVRSVLCGVSVSIPLRGGDLALGTWQGVYLWEHRHAPHRRRIVVTLNGSVRAAPT
jgi:secondary thiamine-phosphate synthase enzyme